MLTDISQKLSRVGIDPGASIYIADSAFVTEDNLCLAADTTLFKDPVLVNAIFLKKPERIEALGLILATSH